MFPLSPTYLNITRDTETMDKQETTSNTLRMTVTIDIDRDTVRTGFTFSTVRRDGHLGAKNIANNLEEMGITVKNIDVSVQSVTETKD